MTEFGDARPGGLNVSLRPGNTFVATLNWPAGMLTGRTFTSTLDGDPITVSVLGDVMTITVTEAQTATLVGTVEWLLTETTGGETNDVLIGKWTPSDNPGSGTGVVAEVSEGGVVVDITVNGISTAQLADLTAAIDALPELVSSDPAKVPLPPPVAGVQTIDVERTVPEVAYLTADSTPVNNSGVPVNVTGLAVPVAANAVYMVTGLVFYTAHADADFKLQWTTPAGVSGTWALQGENTTTANAVTVIATTWASSRAVAGKDASTGAALMYGTLVTGSTAGTLQAQFAQQTAHASDAIVKAHTLISAQRVD